MLRHAVLLTPFFISDTQDQKMLENQKMSIMHVVRICPLFIFAAALFDVSAQRKGWYLDVVCMFVLC